MGTKAFFVIKAEDEIEMEFVEAFLEVFKRKNLIKEGTPEEYLEHLSLIKDKKECKRLSDYFRKMFE